MRRTILRAVAAAVAGAFAGGILLAIAFAVRPGVTLDMDRDLPRIAPGFHPAERDGDRTFTWTSRRAQLTLAGLNRQSPWQCTVRVRGARPDGVAQPVLALEVDGVTTATRPLSNDFEDVTVGIPARRSAPGVRLGIVAEPPFTPGPGDRRELGAQVDSIACHPTAALALPPLGALAVAALTAALFGLASGLAGLSAGAAIGTAFGVAAAQSIPLSHGLAPYHAAYLEMAAGLAMWIALPLFAAATFIRRRHTLSGPALFVLVFTAAAIYLKLLALLHPSKLVIDAVFHAHRLEWVLAGRYFFTQPIQSGVQFPYAIGLYVFAAPWTMLTRDYVSLLRIVVATLEGFAGGLLYLMVIRAWNDRLAGVLSVVFFALVPLPFVVVGNANLANAFGGSTSLVAIAAATIWMFGTRRVVQIGGLALLIALPLLSHVSTFGLLSVTLVALGTFYWLTGNRALRGPSLAVLAATVIAIVFSVAVYYGHFSDAYRTVRNVRGEVATAPAGDAAASPPGVNAPPTALVSLPARTTNAVVLTVGAIGWPILGLAVVGCWRLLTTGARDRLTLAVAAWAVAYLTFATIGVLTPVEARYARYADEFIARAVYGTYPAAVVLAGLGAAWAWRTRHVARLAMAALVAWAAAKGVQLWNLWIS